MQISAISLNNNFKGYSPNDDDMSAVGYRRIPDSDMDEVMDKYERLKKVSAENLPKTSPFGRFATVTLATLSTALIAGKLSAKALGGIEKALPLSQPLERLGNKMSNAAENLAKRAAKDVTSCKTFFSETGYRLQKFALDTLGKLGQKGLKEGAANSQVMINGVNQAVAKATGIATGATVLVGTTRDRDKDGVADAFQRSDASINNKKGVVGFLSSANDICEAAGAFLGAA